MTPSIQPLLSARLFLSPQRAGKRLYFISNLSGRLSLYAMDCGGSVPEPLLPPDIALQNQELIGGHSFYVLPYLRKLLVMIDSDGDENYQPMLIPVHGGIPEPAFGGRPSNYRVHLADCFPERHLAYFAAESRNAPVVESWQANLRTGQINVLRESKWGAGLAANRIHTKAVLTDGYTFGDNVLYLWSKRGELTRLYGTPLEERSPDYSAAFDGISHIQFTSGDRGLLFITALFDDAYGLGYLSLSEPGEILSVKLTGIRHRGQGELVALEHTHGIRYYVQFNIEGCSWLYEGRFAERNLRFTLDTLIAGKGKLANGVLHSVHYDPVGDSYSFAFTTATSPAQIYTVDGKRRKTIRAHTRERILGVSQKWLSPGEDASFVSFDGTPVSARLYLPAKSLGFDGPRPLVYYIHGGPQGQERPDYTWFSMPLIQYLTLNGCAVFVPNARGSTATILAIAFCGIVRAQRAREHGLRNEGNYSAPLRLKSRQQQRSLPTQAESAKADFAAVGAVSTASLSSHE